MREISREFVIRNSTLTKNEIFKLYSLEKKSSFYNEILQNESHKERIYISNPKLNNSNSNSDKLEFTLAKYYLRMGFRTTPYGLFSSYSTSSNFINENKKSITLSFEWLENVIENIEKKLIHNEKMNFFLNAELEYMDEFIYIYQYNEGKNLKYRFKSTETFNDLISSILNGDSINYNNLTNIEKKLLQLLFERKIIKTELFRLSNELKTLLVLADLINFYFPVLSYELKQLYTTIVDYSFIEVGKGLDTYKYIISKMDKIYSVNSNKYLNIYLLERKNEYLENIEEKIKFNDLLKAIEIKIILEANEEQEIMDKLLLDFSERYGLYNEVYLTDYLKEIDIRNIFEKNKLTYKEKKENEIINKLIKLHPNKQEIILTEKDINFICNSNNKISLENFSTNGFNLNVQAIINNNKTIKLSLYNTQIASGIKSFYAKIFDLKDFNDYNNNSIYSGIPVNIRTNEHKDISHNFSNEKIKITEIGTDEDDINISELLIGMNESGVYLKNKITNDYIVPYFNDLYFSIFFNEKPIIKFLYIYADFINNNYQMNNYTNKSFTPRIIYRDIIISEKTWRIFKYEFEYLETKLNFNNFLEFIIKKIDELDIPDYVLINDISSVLPLKKGSMIFYRIMYEVFKRNNTDFLELIDGTEYMYNENIKNHEFIFSISPANNTKKLNENFTSGSYSLNKPDLETSNYSIIYNYYSYEEIVVPLLKLLYDFSAENVFFINYRKNNFPELRIRFKENKKIEILFIDELNTLINKKVIMYYSKEVHSPEYNRYLGEKEYNKVREYFHLDTKKFYINNAAMKTLREEEKIFYLVKRSLKIFVNLFGDLEELEDYLNKNYSKNPDNYLYYKKHREIFKELSYEVYYEKTNDIEFKVLDGLKSTFYSNNTQNRIYYAILSIQHMMFNRNYGINSIIEKKVFEITYYCFKYYKRIYNLNIKGKELEK